jgi:hypothetical protein
MNGGGTKVLRTVLTLFLMGFCLNCASQKPNFSGTWELNHSESQLQIPPPASTVFLIEHKEPDFILTRTHFYEEESDTWSIHLTTDGNEVIQEDGNEKFVGRLFWEGNELVFSSEIFVRNRRATNIVTYSLSQDGRILTATENFRGPVVEYENIWVFVKKDNKI